MKNLSILNLLVFTCFLVVGYTFSIRFYQAGNSNILDSANGVTVETHTTLPSLKNGQHTLLLIYTDTITSQNPRLESIWLASFFDTGTYLQLLPIYPSEHKSLTDMADQLDRSFHLIDAKGSLTLDPTFVEMLKKHNYWWSGYIVFDDFAFAKLVKTSGISDEKANPIPESQASRLLSADSVDPQKAYLSQLTTIQSLCQNIISAHPGKDLSRLISQSSNHIVTDLDVSQLRMGLETISSQEQSLICRFPTFEIARLGP